MKIFSSAFYDEFYNLYGKEVFYLARNGEIESMEIGLHNINNIIMADKGNRLYWTHEAALEAKANR